MQVFIRHLWVLTTEELYDLVWRKRSCISLVLYLVVLIGAMYWFSRAQSRFVPLSNVLAVAPQIEELRFQLSKFGLQNTVDFIIELSRYPASLWMFQLFSLVWLPTLVGLVSCDMVSIDIDRGTLRFVLQRSSRLAYYLSKGLAHLVLFLSLQVASMVGLIVICAFTAQDFELGDYLALGARYFIVSIPFILFVVASTEWVSSWSRKPMSAILRLNILWVVFFVLLGWNGDLSPLSQRSLVGLLLPFQEYFVSSMGSLLGWASAFGFLGLVGFLRRDV